MTKKYNIFKNLSYNFYYTYNFYYFNLNQFKKNNKNNYHNLNNYNRINQYINKKICRFWRKHLKN